MNFEIDNENNGQIISKNVSIAFIIFIVFCIVTKYFYDLKTIISFSFLFFLILLFFNREYGPEIYFALIPLSFPLSFSTYGSEYLSGTRIVGIVLMVLFINDLVFHKNAYTINSFLYTKKYLRIWISFILYTVLWGFLLNSNKSYLLNSIINQMTIIIPLFYFFSKHIYSNDRMFKLFDWIVIISFYNAIFTILQFIIGKDMFINLESSGAESYSVLGYLSASGLFPHRNDNGIFMLLSVSILVSKYYILRSVKFIEIFMFSVIVVAIVLTFGRTPILGIGIIYFIISFISIIKTRGFLRKLGNLLIGILLISISLSYIYSRYYDFVDVRSRDGSNIIQKGEALDTALEILQENERNILFGIGPGNFERFSNYSSTHFTFYSMHNGFLQVLVEEGVIGLSLILIFLFLPMITLFIKIIKLTEPSYVHTATVFFSYGIFMVISYNVGVEFFGGDRLHFTLLPFMLTFVLFDLLNS